MATPIRQAQGKQKKIDTVKVLTEKLARAKALYLVDPAKLSHKQLEAVRKMLKKTDAELQVAKNTLLKRAIADAKKTLPETHLTGSTALVTAYADEVSPLKELVSYLKTAAVGKVKVGFLGSTEIAAADIQRLADLPGREALLAQLVGQLQAPLYGLHNALSWNMRKLVWTLDALKSKKSNTAVSS